MYISRISAVDIKARPSNYFFRIRTRARNLRSKILWRHGSRASSHAVNLWSWSRHTYGGQRASVPLKVRVSTYVFTRLGVRSRVQRHDEDRQKTNRPKWQRSESCSGKNVRSQESNPRVFTRNLILDQSLEETWYFFSLRAPIYIRKANVEESS